MKKFLLTFLVLLLVSCSSAEPVANDIVEESPLEVQTDDTTTTDVVVLVKVVVVSSVTGSEGSTEISPCKGSAEEHEIKIKINKVSKYFLIGF